MKYCAKFLGIFWIILATWSISAYSENKENQAMKECAIDRAISDTVQGELIYQPSAEWRAKDNGDVKNKIEVEYKPTEYGNS